MRKATTEDLCLMSDSIEVSAFQRLQDRGCEILIEADKKTNEEFYYIDFPGSEAMRIPEMGPWRLKNFLSFLQGVYVGMN